MTKAAIVVLAGTDGHENLGRVTNALEAAREFAEHPDDDLELVFDGAGTQWVPELEDPESDMHELYRTVRDQTSVCEYCAGAFGVDDNDGHPSIRSLVDDDYEVITF